MLGYTSSPWRDGCLIFDGDPEEVWCLLCADHVVCMLRSQNKVRGIRVSVILRNAFAEGEEL